MSMYLPPPPKAKERLTIEELVSGRFYRCRLSEQVVSFHRDEEGYYIRYFNHRTGKYEGETKIVNYQLQEL